MDRDGDMSGWIAGVLVAALLAAMAGRFWPVDPETATPVHPGQEAVVCRPAPMGAAYLTCYELPSDVAGDTLVPLAWHTVALAQRDAALAAAARWQDSTVKYKGL